MTASPLPFSVSEERAADVAQVERRKLRGIRAGAGQLEAIVSDSTVDLAPRIMPSI